MDVAEGPRPTQRGRPRGWQDRSAQTIIKSLDRAMQVLEYLSTTEGLPLTALAEATGQAPATVYRVLVTLEARGLVEFAPEDQTWHVGACAYAIGARFLRRTNLVERARPVLRWLMEQTGETANLGIQKGTSVLFVSQVETWESIRAFFAPGTLAPMHSSGIGKALMAKLPERRLSELLAQPRTRFTPNTLTESSVLLADLEATRARGYALDDEEKELGMRCIAAPVLDASAEAVAGLSVSGPTARITSARVSVLAGPVQKAAADLTQAIGGAPG